MSRKKGSRAEEQALDYLLDRGYQIAQRNFYSRFGEIDIIAIKDDVIHFVEVKSGVSFEPLYNITPAKLEKIIKTANYYCMVHKITLAISIDALLVRGESMELIENITL